MTIRQQTPGQSSPDPTAARIARVKMYAKNPHTFGELYPAHAGSDSPQQDRERAFRNDLREVADMAARCEAAERERDGLVKANSLLMAGMGSQEELRSDEKQRLRTAEARVEELEGRLAELKQGIRTHAVCRCEECWTGRGRHAPDCLWDNVAREVLEDAEYFPPRIASGPAPAATPPDGG